jgi:hypothetical protein
MYTKFVSKRLDCPKNNPDIQGLEKDDVKNLVKETEKAKKDLDGEIKTLNGEIKSESDADRKSEKTEQRNEKIKEVKEIENKLKDYKVVEKSGWQAQIPNKFSTANVI